MSKFELAEVIMYFSRDRKTWIIYKTHINGNETDIKLVGIKVLKIGCDPLVWLGQRMGLHSFYPPPSFQDWCWCVSSRHPSLISAHPHLLPPPSNPKKFCRSEKLRQVLKCTHERLWEEDCVIFASEWCNSKAMIESKTITMKQFSTSAYFPYFFRYSVFSLRWCLPRGVSDETSVNWKYCSFRRMGEWRDLMKQTICNKQIMPVTSLNWKLWFLLCGCL